MPNEEEEKTIVISCEEDRTLCQPALNAGIPIVNAEFILTGILQYDISVSKYPLIKIIFSLGKMKIGGGGRSWFIWLIILTIIFSSPHRQSDT